VWVLQALGWKLTLAGQTPIQFLIASTPGAALGDGKKLVDRFMAGKPKTASQEPICKNFLGVDHALEPDRP
jgi:hypothetical protein